MLTKAQGYVNRVRRILEHPGNKEAPIKALARALRWRAHWLVSQDPIEIEVFGNLKYRADNSGFSRSIVYHTAWFEYDEMHFVSSYLRPGDMVLDVGANAGIYSLLASMVLQGDGRVDAIEPVPSTFARLRANIESNRLGALVHLHNLAVAEVEGTVDMTTDRDGTNHVVASGTGVSVPAVRLDHFTGERRYAFAKMDVEGMEFPALRSAGQEVDSGNPAVWMIEVNGSLHRYGFTVADILKWANDAGYDVTKYDHGKRRLNMPSSDQVWGNVFLIHRTAWSTVRDRMPSLTVPQQAWA